jgi:uncharacterized protein YjgD (DUF1641 family)
MAPPVPFKQVMQPDPREDTTKRIEYAQLGHVDAVLAAYDLLQKLHDNGTLDLLRGAAGARDALVKELAVILDTPEAVMALRNLVIVLKTLGGVDLSFLPRTLEDIAQTATAKTIGEPPSLWELSKRLRTNDARRGLATAVGVLEALGRAVDRG